MQVVGIDSEISLHGHITGQKLSQLQLGGFEQVLHLDYLQEKVFLHLLGLFLSNSKGVGDEKVSPLQPLMESSFPGILLELTDARWNNGLSISELRVICKRLLIR
ncbi:hypothetical protein K7X08_010204 [Anisodus acutangulus]|uniref:Uncharacterized protein n=1 Tax=Anisodus acutangulus TaxID=402998 RepID=A0A9Q1N184_9SOLA|nr:hypothetical protein K7X08_010204 [Anisodus acutangulus]